ncbi:MAG: polysaccharide deacetylase family protein [Patescibacteria group bacterium]
MIATLLKSVKTNNLITNLTNNLVKNIKINSSFYVFFIVFFLFSVFLVNPAKASIFNLKLSSAQNIPILMYHYIEPAPASSTLKGLYLDPAIFRSQLNEIKKDNYNSVFVSEAANSLISKKSLPKNSLALTFDDGYEDFYMTVFPLLKKCKIKATVYVIINALDKPGYLTKNQLRELANSEYIEIGSHTFNHPDLTTLNQFKSEYEIIKSKKALEDIINKPVLSFCYPFGRYQNYDVKLASRAGYLAALTTASGVSHNKSELMALTRLRPGARSGQEFSNWLKSLFKEKSALF